MDRITIIPFKGTDIHILYKKGQLGYSFERDGKSYGQRVTLNGKSIVDIVSATFLLLVSCVESMEALAETAKTDASIGGVQNSAKSTN